MTSVKRFFRTWLVLGAGLALDGCVTAPQQTICVIGDIGADCVTTFNNDKYHLTFDQMKNYTARPPETEQALIEWARRNCKGPK